MEGYFVKAALIIFFIVLVFSPMVYAALPSIPEFPDPMEFFSIRRFISFWMEQTYGLFVYVVAVLMVASVYLKTHSVSLSIITAGLLIATFPWLGWLAVFIAVGLAWLLYRAFYKKTDYY